MAWKIARDVPQDDHLWKVHLHDQREVASITFSADDAEVWWTTRDGLVFGVDAATGTQVQQINGRPGMVVAAGAKPEWILIAVASHLLVWDRSARGWHTSIDGKMKSPITAVLALDEDRVLTGHEDGGIRRWSLGQQKLLRGQFKAKALKGPIACLTPTGDGGFLGGGGGGACIWGADPKEEPVLLRTEPSAQPILHVDVRGDEVLIGGRAGIGTFDRSGAPRAAGRRLPTDSRLAGAFLVEDGVLLSGIASPLERGDATLAELDQVLRGALPSVTAIDHARTRVVGGGSGAVGAYDVTPDTWHSVDRKVWPTFVAGGTSAAVVGYENGRLDVWSAKSGSRTHQYEQVQDDDYIAHASWIDEEGGTLRVVHKYGVVRDWDVQTGEVVERVDWGEYVRGVGPDPARRLVCVHGKPARAFAPNFDTFSEHPELAGFGHWVASADAWFASVGPKVHRVDPESLAVVGTVFADQSAHRDLHVVDLAVSPSGQHLLARTHAKLRLLSSAELDPVKDLDGATDAMFLDDDTLLVIRADRIARLDLATGELRDPSPTLARPRRLVRLGQDAFLWVNADGRVGVLRDVAD